MPINAQPIHAIGKNRYIIAGSFAPAGVGAVTDVYGSGFTVARTGVGVYVVTLAEKWMRLLSAQLTLQMVAVVAADLQLGATDVAGAKTITINSWGPTAAGNTAAVALEIAADANNRVHFEFVMSNDSVQT